MEFLHNIGTHPFDLDGLVQYGGLAVVPLCTVARACWCRAKRKGK